MTKMKMQLFYLIFLFASIVSCAQNNVKLVVKPLKDTVFIGENLRLRFSLEGIQSDFLEFENNAKHHDYFDAFFETKPTDNNFHTNIRIVPDKLGDITYGPYKIKLGDHEIVSNEIIVHVMKWVPENIVIEMPENCKLNEEIRIKFTNYSLSDYSLSLKESDLFKIKLQSSSTNITNGKFSKELILTVILTKKGTFTLDKSMFLNLPENVSINAFEFKVE